MTNNIIRAAAALTLTFAAAPALAHHPLGGMPMETFTHGVLSGIGHPLLGFDHLFFVIAMGVAAALWMNTASPGRMRSMTFSGESVGEDSIR